MAAVNMELAGQVAAAEGLRHEDKALVRLWTRGAPTDPATCCGRTTTSDTSASKT